MPVKVAFMQLSSCWGCHQSLLNAHLELLPVLSQLEIVYWPAVVDFKLDSLKARNDGEIVVGFVEGHLRTELDRSNLILMRKKCQIIVALGACANHGSVASLANLFSKEELLKYKFQDEPSIGLTDVPDGFPNDYENITPITDRVYTVPQLVDIEVKIPGCPPRTENIVSAIAYLLGLLSPGPENQNSNLNVCDSCALNSSGCFLDNNKICFGSITAGDCELKCPEIGDPCVGCYNETSNVGPRNVQLMEMLGNLEKFDREIAVDIKKFLELYLGLANLEFMYFKKDLIQRLAKHPETFEEKMTGKWKMLAVSHTGDETIDNIIGLMLYRMKDNPEFKYSQKTVCSTCDREIVDKIVSEIKRDYEGLPSTEKCFLEEGYVCIGPATQAGCGTLCPNKANAPCLGCYGPPENVPDQGIKFLTTFASLAQLEPEQINEKVIDPAGLFYRFTLASSILKKKVDDTKLH